MYCGCGSGSRSDRGVCCWRLGCREVSGDTLIHNLPDFLLIQTVRGGVINIQEYLLQAMLDQVCSQQVVLFFHNTIFADI
jgi:hypothetical protein